MPASEILLFPDLVWTRTRNLVAVLISRSGQTSEVVRVAEFLRTREIATIAISCASDQPLEQVATASIILSQADEQSTVMTRSFSSMLLALQYLAGTMVGNAKITQAMQQLSVDTEKRFAVLPEGIKNFVERNKFDDYVCLGQGPFYGLACESALKLTEMSCSYGQSFHTLEFRHGPKSITAPETLVIFLLSESGYRAELEVLEEIKSLGATTIALSPKAEPRVRAAADIFVEMPSHVPELVRAPAYVFVPQLLALYTGLKKGLNPDEPRNLSRVVMLSDEVNPQHAAL
jgi:glucosamine--fructose-6-phosphate aminotransferase (isomerizing)